MIGIAPRWLRITTLQVALPALPPRLQGVRIAHLSDFHLGAWGMTQGHLHQARKVAVEFEPDIVALTGDFYDSGKDLPSNGLYAAWPAGASVFAVMGNHDRRGVPGTLERIQAEQKRAGVAILNNEAIEFTLRGQPAWVVGVDDAHSLKADVGQAFGMLPDGQTALLFMSHTPAPICQMPSGRAMLMLAGHTHGGQVRIIPSGRNPLANWIRKLRGVRKRPDGPVYRGWHWMKGAVLVVSDGLGVSTMPIRFLTRPHIILIELDEAPPHADFACDDVDRYVTELDPEPWPVSIFS